jgi:hypothetical protein
MLRRQGRSIEAQRYAASTSYPIRKLFSAAQDLKSRPDFQLAFAGVLEVYNVVQCGDYPSTGSISFYNLAPYNDNFAKIANPTWTVGKASSSLSPQCSYGGSLPKQLTLNY